MPTRCFEFADQLAFAELSGDFNPMHVDPLAARRLFSGEPVVHGIHLLLATLEAWLTGPTPPTAARLRAVTAKFRRPAIVGRPIDFEITAGTAGTVVARVVGDGTLLATIDFGWEPAEPHTFPTRSRPRPGQCRARTGAELATASGFVDLDLESAVLERLLPGLARRLPERQLAQLIATSRLVGMECPGLNSIFGELHVEFGPEPIPADRLDYAVREFNDRYHTVAMTIGAPGLTGRIQAFVRPEPVAQPSAVALRPRVAAAAFAGHRALVVGGSRGIGEVTAKLLALGGADVRITYARGRADAEAVVADIEAAGGRAAALAYDILEPRDSLRQELGAAWQPTHLYYFPTPPLAAGSVGSFSHASFATFCRFYVDGFADAVLGVRSFSPALEGVFYPSTVALDAAPGSMAEYAAAKAAGEALCDYFARHLRGIRFFKTRLPRISTDLTASLLPVAAQDAVDVMLDRLTRFSGG